MPGFVDAHYHLDPRLEPVNRLLAQMREHCIDRVALIAFVDSVERWVAERLRAEGSANANLPRLARLAQVWENIARSARDTQDYNLERRPLVFSVFSMLAEATR